MGSADVRITLVPAVELEILDLTVLRLGRRLRVASSKVKLDGGSRARVRLPPSWWLAITAAIEAHSTGLGLGVEDRSP
jgi:hypothetical protein